MSRQPYDENEFLKKIHTTLDQSVATVDEATRGRLAEARRHAVSQIGRRPLVQPVTMLAMAASVAVLAIGVSLWWPTATGTIPAADDLALISAGEDFELLEDLEFYRWLEATGHTG